MLAYIYGGVFAVFMFAFMIIFSSTFGFFTQQYIFVFFYLIVVSMLRFFPKQGGELQDIVFERIYSGRPKNTYFIATIFFLFIFVALFFSKILLAVYLGLTLVSILIGSGGMLFFILSIFSLVVGFFFIIEGNTQNAEAIFIHLYYMLVGGTVLEFLNPYFYREAKNGEKSQYFAAEIPDNRILSVCGVVYFLGVLLWKKYLGIDHELFFYSVGVYSFVFFALFFKKYTLKNTCFLSTASYYVLIIFLIIFVIFLFLVNTIQAYMLLNIFSLFFTLITFFTQRKKRYLHKENEVYTFSLWLFLGFSLFLFIYKIFDLSGYALAGLLYAVIFTGGYFICVYFLEKNDFESMHILGKKIFAIFFGFVFFVFTLFWVIFGTTEIKNIFFIGEKQAGINIKNSQQNSLSHKRELSYIDGKVSDFFDISPHKLPLGWESSRKDIETLQKILKFVDYYQGDINGLYTQDTKIALKKAATQLCNFDISRDAIFDKKLQQCLAEKKGKIEQQYIDKK